jgi:site-specific DNA-methyltransferase (adenine-specific)
MPNLIEFTSSKVTILLGDCIDVMKTLPAQSFHTCITSPPYFSLRDYQIPGQIGQEASSEAYIDKLVTVFREMWRVLRDDGTFWLVIGDCYAKDKNRLLIPAQVAIALKTDGWCLRDEIIWEKPRCTPMPIKDRTCASHEMLYMFTKQSKGYYYDYLAIEEPSLYAGAVKNYTAGTQKNVGNVTKAPGSVAREIIVRDTRRKRSVWSVSPEPLKQGHFASFPTKLIEPCVLAGCPEGGHVLDPFGGTGTTGLVAQRNRRNATLIELNPEYIAFAYDRLGIVQAT